MDKENKPTWEQFKEELLRWKNIHTEEYNRFARVMQSCDATGFMQFYNKIIKIMPELDSQWKQTWDSEDPSGIDSMVVAIRESELPQNIWKEYTGTKDNPIDNGTSLGHTVMNFIRRVSGIKPVPMINLSSPMVLSWLVFGKSFETIYEILVSQMGKPGLDFQDRETCLRVGRALIQSSINSRYRTEEDWRDYFRRRIAIGTGEIGDWVMEEISKEFISPETVEAPSTDTIPASSITDEPIIITEPKPSGRRKSESKPLIEYLRCENKETVIDIIREYIKANNTGNGVALPYFALTQLDLFTRMISDKEYSVAIDSQYVDIENRISASSCRQSVGRLRRQQYVMIGGKQRNGTPIESDEIAPILEKLKKDITAAVTTPGVIETSGTSAKNDDN